MRLVAFGCSNTYGHALDNPTTEAWPAILSDLTGHEVINNGVSGASNLEILHNVLTYPFQSTDAVIIMWTIVNRDALFHTNGLQQLGVWQETELIRHWVAVHDEFDLIKRSWLNIHHANLHCASSQLPCYNFAVDYKRLAAHRPKFIDTPLLDANVDVFKFIDRAHDKMHPGAKAHINIANKIRSMINVN